MSSTLLKRALTVPVLILVMSSMAACGDEDTATDAGSQSQQQGQQGGPGGMAGSGEVVEVSGTTAQVQGTSGQTAVSWTDDTTFTQQVDGSAADVTVGACVVVQTDAESESDTVEASSVRITGAVDGECSGFGGGGGPQGGTPPSGDAPEMQDGGQMPEGGEMPEGGMPSGAPGGGRGMGTIGEVTAVTDAGFTVSATQPSQDGEGETTEVAVTTSDDTTYTTTESATAHDVQVGVCVTSRGESDDTGALTATSIAISQKVDDACSTGFGGGMREREQEGS